MKDLGKENHLIGWTILHDSTAGTMHISQPQLTKDFIVLLRMNDAKEEPAQYCDGINMAATQKGDTALDFGK